MLAMWGLQTKSTRTIGIRKIKIGVPVVIAVIKIKSGFVMI